MENEYIINGIVYSYQNHFDDDLFEAYYRWKINKIKKKK